MAGVHGHDTTAELYFAPSQFEAYLDYAFAGVADGKVVARAFSVPFAFNVEGRDELPDGGWDQVIRWAHEDRMIGRASNRHCPGVRGTVKPLAHHTL